MIVILVHSVCAYHGSIQLLNVTKVNTFTDQGNGTGDVRDDDR